MAFNVNRKKEQKTLHTRHARFWRNVKSMDLELDLAYESSNTLLDDDEAVMRLADEYDSREGH